MSTDVKSQNKPSHRVYAVVKRDGDASIWDEIGAVWPHKDGKGFNLKLSYLPLNGGELVIRKPKSQSEAGNHTAAPAELEGGL